VSPFTGWLAAGTVLVLLGIWLHHPLEMISHTTLGAHVSAAAGLKLTAARRTAKGRGHELC